MDALCFAILVMIFIFTILPWWLYRDKPGPFYEWIISLREDRPIPDIPKKQNDESEPNLFWELVAQFLEWVEPAVAWIEYSNRLVKAILLVGAAVTLGFCLYGLTLIGLLR